MDPITAVANAVQAVAEMVTEISKGQPLEVKAQLWTWWVEDQKFWRELLKPH